MPASSAHAVNLTMLNPKVADTFWVVCVCFISVTGYLDLDPLEISFTGVSGSNFVAQVVLF